MTNITSEQLRELFDYNEKNGVLLWKEIPKTSQSKSWLAGCVMNDAYIVIGINGKSYLAHRLIWAYVTGEWPEYIDHIDHNGLNNRFNNLREVTHGENIKNLSRAKNNKSGVTGLWLDKRYSVWTARINVNKKNVNLGSFKDKFEAICARKSAEVKYGFHENHGR